MAAARGENSGTRIRTYRDAVEYFAPGFAGMRRESFRVVHLDARQRMLGVRLHYSEHCEAVDFPIRQIIADALQLGATGLLLAHNHPSGDPSPSRADIAATRVLSNLADPLDLKVHDHLIFADGENRSLRVLGLL